MDKFTFWKNYLLIVSGLLCIQGISWVVIGSFDPFGFYETLMAKSFWQTQQLTPEAQQVFRFILVPFGATDAAYFLLFFLVVKFAFASRERWAYFALLVATSFWFILDTVFCLYLKAYFNILVVNIPCAFLLAIAFIATRKYFSEESHQGI